MSGFLCMSRIYWLLLSFVCSTWSFCEKLAMAERALTRVHSLRERVDETLASSRNEIVALLSR